MIVNIFPLWEAGERHKSFILTSPNVLLMAGGCRLSREGNAPVQIFQSWAEHRRNKGGGYLLVEPDNGWKKICLVKLQIPKWQWLGKECKIHEERDCGCLVLVPNTDQHQITSYGIYQETWILFSTPLPIYRVAEMTPLFLASVPSPGTEDPFMLSYFLSWCPSLLFLCNLIFSSPLFTDFLSPQ